MLSNEQKLTLAIAKKEIGMTDSLNIAMNINWIEVYNICCNNGMSFLAYKHLEGISIYNLFLRKYIYSAKRFLIQSFKFLCKLTELLTQKHIPYILIKGFVYSDLYGGIENREMGDFDLLVHKEDIYEIFEILKILKCEQIISSKRTIEYNSIAIDENAHQILEFQVEFEGTLVFFELNISMHCIKEEKYMNKIWSNTEERKIHNVYFTTLNLQYQLINICEHIFSNSEHTVKPRLREYVDLALFLKKNRDNICWDNIKEEVTFLNINYVLYHALYNLNKLFGDECIGNNIINMFDFKNERSDICDILNNHACIIDWKTDILERLTQKKPQKLLDEYQYFLKIRNNNNNPNKNNLIICPKVNEKFPLALDTMRFESFYVNRLGIYIKYLVCHSTNNIKFILNIPDILYFSLYKYNIYIEIFNNDNNDSKNHMIKLKIKMNNYNIMCEQANIKYGDVIKTNFDSLETYQYNHKRIIQVNLPKKYFPYDIGKKLFCFRIMLSERFEWEDNVYIEHVLLQTSDNIIYKNWKSKFCATVAFPKIIKIVEN